MTDVCLACPDLMTASRFMADGVRVRSIRTFEELEQVVQENGQEKNGGRTTLIVELQACSDLGKEAHAGSFRDKLWIVGFAPHVQEALLESSQEWCNLVMPRGAAISRFPKYVYDNEFTGGAA